MPASLRRLRALPLAALALSCATAPRPTATAPEGPPLLQLPAGVRPLRYALSLRIVPTDTRFEGTAEIDIQLEAARAFVWMHGRNLQIRSASVQQEGSAPLRAAWEPVAEEGVARLAFERPLGPGRATLRLAWDAPYDPHRDGLYLAHENGRAYALTQFECDYARRAFPSFDDPQFKTPFDVTLTVPDGLVAVANTPVAEEAPLPGGLRRVRFRTSRPLPTYLLAWAVGPFDVVVPPPLPPNEVRSRPLQVRGLAPKGRGGELEYALRVGGELLVALERYFGLEYPYEKLDHVVSPGQPRGGMENAGAIVYGESALLFQPGVSSEEIRFRILATVTHELAHMWFGDLVTLRWWTDTWLNESFATWLEDRTVAQWNPSLRTSARTLAWVQSIMDQDGLASARAIRQPLRRMAEVWDQFDGMSYGKGAAVLGMFERWVGPEAYRDGIRAYVRARVDGTGDTDELLGELSRAAGRDVGAPMRTFLEQPGVPLVQVQVACEGGRARLELTQSRELPIGSRASPDALWQVPVCARWGEGGAAGEACTLLAAKTGTMELGVRCPDWVLPNADAAGYYRWSLPSADLARLLSALPKLTLRERMSVASNLVSAVRGARIPFAEVLPALQALARDAEPEVAAQPVELLRFAEEHLVPDELRPRVAAHVRDLYGPVLARLGWQGPADEDMARRRLRDGLIELLARVGRDPEVIREAARLGRAYAGLAEGRFQPQAASPDVATTVLSIAVREGDAALFDALLERLRTEQDAVLRVRTLTALAATTDPRRAARLLALPADARLRERELWMPFAQLGAHRETRDLAWAAVQAQFDALRPRAGPWGATAMLDAASGYCDGSRAQEVRAFVEARLQAVPEARRTMEQTVEGIELCAAQKQAHAPAARAFFAGAR